MLRSQFIKLCVLSGAATASGLLSGKAEALQPELKDALQIAGLTDLQVTQDGNILKIQAKISDFEAFSRKAGHLGNGQVRSSRNLLTFEHQGKLAELRFTA